jgi:hypothetical protein
MAFIAESLETVEPILPPSSRSGVPEWPAHSLYSFVMRMAFHGRSVSGSLMQSDRLYALRQLAEAHAMDDADLQDLSLALFRHFERCRSGVYH